MKLFKFIFILATLIVFVNSPLLAQEDDSTFAETEEDHEPRFGIGLTFSCNYTLPFIKKSDWNQPPVNYNDGLTDIYGKGNFSFFNVGIILQFPVTERIDIRPQFFIQSRKFTLFYVRSDTLTDFSIIQMEYMAFSVHLTYKFNYNSKIHTTFSCGPNLRKNISPEKADQPFDLSIDFGFGLEKARKKIGINQLELQYSLGFTDLIRTRNNVYNSTIGKLTVHTISLVINLCNSMKF